MFVEDEPTSDEIPGFLTEALIALDKSRSPAPSAILNCGESVEGISAKSNHITHPSECGIIGSGGAIATQAEVNFYIFIRQYN